ncbi:MAG: hypothetical protein EOP68_04840, partial [Sphingomonas sp.]
MDDLLQEFVAETRETLEALSGEIVLWEAAPADRARLDAIFRFVHTVKGSCGFLDLPRLGHLAHVAEEVLAQVRDGQRTPDTGLVSAVLAIVDRIGELTDAIDAGRSTDDTTDDLLIAALAEDAAPAATPVAETPQHARAVNRSVRLGVELLDRMMAGMSDMVLARNELARRLRDGDVDPRVEGALDRLSLTVAEMRDTITRTRMQRIDALFSPIPRMVRDLAAPLGKQVALSIEGGDVELDREMIELLRDPFVHIIRNAVDHGIGSPADRREVGKPETGNLRICARQSGNQILIEIEDDGRGVNTDRLVEKAIAAGILSELDAQRLGDQARTDLIFHAGLSSRDTVTAVSGRGVGMDVVRANIEQIGGRVAVRNRPGQGLSLILQVPLTLSIIPTIVLAVGGQRYAMPRQSIEEIVSLANPSVRIDPLGGGRIATLRGERQAAVGEGLAGEEPRRHDGGGGGLDHQFLGIKHRVGGEREVAVAGRHDREHRRRVVDAEDVAQRDERQPLPAQRRDAAAAERIDPHRRVGERDDLLDRLARHGITLAANGEDDGRDDRERQRD